MSDALHALQRAIAAVKAGNKAAGRRLLAEVIRDDPHNEAAWLWMSAATDSDAQRRACLERVLAINPDNQTARRGLARLDRTSGETSSASQPPGGSSPGATLPAAKQAPPWVGQVHKARAVLPAWSLVVAFGAAIVVYATIGIAAYLALSGAVGFLRGHLKIHFAPAWPE